MNRISDNNDTPNNEEERFNIDHSLTFGADGNVSGKPLPDDPSDADAGHREDEYDIDNEPTMTGCQADSTSLSVGKVFAGRYHVLNRIGGGGMGEVYRVQDMLTKRIVALKLIRKELASNHDIRNRFIQEATISQDIKSRNVVNVYDVNQTGDTLYYTMEYLQGVTLRDCLNDFRSNNKRMSVDDIRYLIVSVCRGLHDAHQVTLHRDLKPENIFLVKGSDIKLLDFGLARALHGSRLTQHVQRMGTPYYMAPEQFSGTDYEPAPSIDLYSLGVILYEALTLDVPIGAFKNACEIRHDITSVMDEFIRKCLSTEAAQRPQSAKEFEHGFLSALDPAISTPDGLPKPEPKQPGERAPKPVETPSTGNKEPRAGKRGLGFVAGMVILVILLFLYHDKLPFRQQTTMQNGQGSAVTKDLSSSTPAPEISPPVVVPTQLPPSPQPANEPTRSPPSPKPTVLPTGAPPSPEAVVWKDKCVVLMFDYSAVSDAVSARSTVTRIRQAIQNRGWQVMESDTDGTCRYILGGLLTVREGDSSASMFSGSNIQFAHASAEITLKDLKTGTERTIFHGSEKEGGNSMWQAGERAMRELADVLIPVINDEF
jgi:serine/threonine protein kinase